MGRRNPGGASRAPGRRLGFESLEHRIVLSGGSPATGAETSPEPQAIVGPLAASVLDIYVPTLTYLRFGELSAVQVPLLSLQQVASIPNDYWLGTMSAGARAALSQQQVQALRPAALGLNLLSSQQVGWLTTPQIQSLEFWELPRLSASQTPQLTPQQISTINNTESLAAWSAPARAALTQSQIVALDVANVSIRLLTAQQIGGLSTAQIAAVPYYDLMFLQPSQISQVTSGQIWSIPNVDVLATWSAASRAALTYYQVQSLSMPLTAVGLLTNTQTSWLRPLQVQTVPFYGLGALSPAQIPWLTLGQVASINNTESLATWSPASRAALTESQVEVLNTADVSIRLLTPQQIGWLTPTQIRAIPYYDFVYLAPAQIPALTPAQIASIPNTAALASLTSAARAAMTPMQIQSLQTSTLSIQLLTNQQVAWLSVLQIRALSFWEFPRLSASQVTQLTPAQIASIPNADAFAAWESSVRAALTPAQVQSLNVGAISIGLLSAAQIPWLTDAQIRSLPYYDFPRLQAAQTPKLTTSQIASIPNAVAFAAWESSARAALTPIQVQSLNVGVISLGLLSAAQISWLTDAQLRSLPYYDFPHLQPAQIPKLTATQIASIPRSDVFAMWWPPAVAALTASQIGALSMADLPLQLFTTGQIASLGLTQIQGLPPSSFQYLTTSQIPSLSLAQIRAIPADYILRSWSAASRAALTQSQIQSLTMPATRIDWMTGQQIGWLTVGQLRQLAFYDFPNLQPSQIGQLDPRQFEAITTADFLRTFSDSQLAALTRAQLLSLPQSVYSAYMHLSYAIAPPENYHPASDMPVGPDGLNSTPHTDAEWARVLALVPDSSVTHSTIASGNWSDPAIWSGGVLPGAGARVLVSPGTTVRFDFWMHSISIKTLRVDGVLDFATNRGTQLKADTIVVNTAGALRIGSASAPIRDDVSARIVIADNGPIDTTKDPYLLGRGLLSRGHVEMYGKYVTPFVNLASNAVVGSTQLVLAQTPVNWRVGDELVIAGTDPYIANFRTDRVRIRAINGVIVTVDPLQYSHDIPAGYGLSIQVANLSRNVLFIAEDPSVIAERPHIAFMHNPNVEIDNIGVYGFGRTNKDVRINDAVVVNGVLQPGTGTNQRARYAVHFHHTGVNPEVSAAMIRGSLVVDSPGWGFVNHQSNVVMENNVAFDVLGAAFVTEDGNEIGVMRGNLALQTRGSLVPGDRREIHDFGFAGHGFWFQGPGVAVIDNISAGSHSAGFFYLTASSKVKFDAANLSDPALAAGHDAIPVDSVPLNTFAGNTAYAGGDGLSIWNNNLLMPDGQSVIDRFTSWNSRETGININYSSHILIKDALLVGNLQAFVGTGISTNRWTHDLVITNSRVEGFEIGIVPTVRRSTSINNGYVAAVQGLYVAKGQDSIRTLSLRGTVFADLTPSQLNARRQYDVYATMFSLDEGNDRSPSALFSADVIIIAPFGGVSGKLYFYEQAAQVIPFPAATARGIVPDAYLNKTNQQLRTEFGVSFGGELHPSKLVQQPEVYGLMRYRF